MLLIVVIVVVVVVIGPMLVLEEGKGVQTALCELAHVAVFAVVEYGVVEDEAGVVFDLSEGFIAERHEVRADFGQVHRFGDYLEIIRDSWNCIS